MKKSLEMSEWVISGSLVLILASLLLISQFHEHRKKLQLAAFSEKIERPISIAISGEVSCPGVFSVEPGTRVGDLVKKCRPKRYADLSGIDLDRPVEIACEMLIPQLTAITVKIEGAVAELIELTLPIGSRVSDLKSKVQCEPDADLRFFKRRRLLKHGEVIAIPRVLSPSSSVLEDERRQELD